MKRALLLNAVNPKIGGVLVRGKKGTAKSTAVRSLAALLPEVSVLQGCPYSCAPDARQGLCQWCLSGSNDNPVVTRQVRIVELPVGATEDRLVGSLDIEQAIKTGARSFEPGLIAATHRGILYIDEVNLLNDHLVDVLLDAAAMGRNYVEREGVSVSHAADFILVGTMNPEEGDLRPQLLDRFGLAVEVDGALPPRERREVVLRRIAYEADPFRFMAEWREAEERERGRLLRSRERLLQVEVSGDILELITDICAEYQVDGMRGDIVTYKTARTVAAYEGRIGVIAEDVSEAARLALLHRQRRQPFQQPNLVTEQLDAMIQEFQQQSRQREPSDSQPDGPQDQADGDSDPSDLESPDLSPPEDPSPEEPGPEGPGNQEQQFEVGSPFSVRSLEVRPPDARARQSAGRRSKTVSGTSAGRYVDARVPQGAATDLALDATLRAAAPHQKRRREDQSLPPFEGGTKEGPQPHGPDAGILEGNAGPALLLEPWDVREKVRETKTGSLILFVVDASGSMGAQRRMVTVKGAVLSLLLDAYQSRDRVGLIAFRGTTAELLLPPTNSVELAQTHLAEMPTGGRTPLSRGLHLALQVIEKEKMKDWEVLPLVVLLSDGRANVTLAQVAGPAAVGEDSPTAGEAREVASLFKENRIPSVVIDTEEGFIKLGLARPIAEAMGARCLRLDELRAEGLARAIRLQLPATGGPDPTPGEEPGTRS
jgi:magnesium chelatase subunit D